MVKTMTETYERAAIAIMRMIEVAKQAAIGASALEDKVTMHRLVKRLQGIAHTLRANYYVFEDAERFASEAERCVECGNVVPKEGIRQ